MQVWGRGISAHSGLLGSPCAVLTVGFDVAHLESERERERESETERERERVRQRERERRSKETVQPKLQNISVTTPGCIKPCRYTW